MADLIRNVLDHGSIRLCNLAGPVRRVSMLDTTQRAHMLDGAGPVYVERPFDADDTDPAQAARMSFEQYGSDRTYEEDLKLSRYLLKNMHTSPFEMIQVWVEVKVPIFVDRQFVRHRMWRRNESSGRYIVLPDKYYIPSKVGGKPVGGAKQGQSDTLAPETQEWFKRTLRERCEQDYATYLEAIERGVAPEQARLFLHLNHYVHWLGNVDLGNMFRFLALRDHSHAQIEAQLYAAAIVELLSPHLPGLMDLYRELVRRD